jgi:hypothetical protein
VNAKADRHPISPYIYGMNFADPALAAEIDPSAHRSEPVAHPPDVEHVAGIAAAVQLAPQS